MLGFLHSCAVALQMADHINIHQTCIKDYRKFWEKYMYNGPRVGETFKYKDKDVYFLLHLISEILLQKFNTFKSCFQVIAFMHDYSTD